MTELDAGTIVEPDFVEDGALLESIASRSQDFVIANHVLEHAEDPIGVLCGWSRVLAPHGVLYVTGPLAEGCFDRGRPPTTLAHLVEDHRLAASGRRAELERRNVEHYREWLTVSEPNILRERGDPVPVWTPEALERRATEIAAERAEIHYHTFSGRSFRALLHAVADRHAPELCLRETVGNRREVIGVLTRG
ncbi:MAG: methyltransferase domain-containing protein [Myxococcales bacterium]|nr:methyltransferase domain-containing protein [Myxococcales bacterium]